MKSKLSLLASALGLLAVAPVWAAPITFNFGDCSSIIGASQCPGDTGTGTVGFADTTNIYYVVAHGVDYSFNPIDLFVKNGGGSENGLGLAGTVSNEINDSDTGQAIILDMTDLADSDLDFGTVTLGSLQAGESGLVCNLSATLSCQQVFGSGSTAFGTANVSWGASDPYLLFYQPDPNGGNFLVDSMTASVPEPGTGLLFASCFAGLALVVARRRSARGR